MGYYTARCLGLGMLPLFVGSFSACQKEREAGLRAIAGHSVLKDEVAHGQGMLHAERYCRSCHGEALAGGNGLEPSCYACHGQRWLKTDPRVSLAPAHHTQAEEGWLHEPGLGEPETNCVECHGPTLAGDATLGTPSCLLCHGSVWSPSS